jgi:hypothetical protein
MTFLHIVTLAVAFVFSPLASAQAPSVPTDLKAEAVAGRSDLRLSWTASTGAETKYLIERAGPGLTLYTQIAGPISETNYVVIHIDGELDLGVYKYRVRAVDAALNKGPATPAATSVPQVVTGNSRISRLSICTTPCDKSVRVDGLHSRGRNWPNGFIHIRRRNL